MISDDDYEIDYIDLMIISLIVAFIATIIGHIISNILNKPEMIGFITMFICIIFFCIYTLKNKESG